MADGSDYNEQELLREAKNGNLSAYNRLVQQNMNKVYATALRMTKHKEDAEDIVQQTFVAVIRNLHNFREESAFSTWLLRIAINNTLKLLKKKKKRAYFSSTTEHNEESWDSISLENETPPTWNKNPEELLKNEEIRTKIRESIERLDTKHRAVFVLRDMEGLSTREVAQALEISESNVKIRLMRARLAIRDILGTL